MGNHSLLVKNPETVENNNVIEASWVFRKLKFTQMSVTSSLFIASYLDKFM